MAFKLICAPGIVLVDTIAVEPAQVLFVVKVHDCVVMNDVESGSVWVVNEKVVVRLSEMMKLVEVDVADVEQETDILSTRPGFFFSD